MLFGVTRSRGATPGPIAFYQQRPERRLFDLQLRLDLLFFDLLFLEWLPFEEQPPPRRPWPPAP